MKKVFFIAFSIVGSAVYFFSCDNNSPKRFGNKNIEAGYQLSQKYCISCHQLPDPLLLNKETWANHVLPKMGEFVGFRYLGLNHYVESGIPEIMKLAQWNNIVQYYTTQSPSAPVEGEAKKIRMGLRYFKALVLPWGVEHPATTLVTVNSPGKGFFFGDGLTEQLYLVSPNNVITDTFPVEKGISNLHFSDTSLLALTMGVLQPSDSKEGRLLSLEPINKKLAVVLDSLQRPVHATYADLNSDGLEDIVVCEFGNQSGQLSWFEKRGEKKYAKHILRPLPGAIHTEVQDFNKDGRPDIMALMAQGDEGIFIYYNQGNNVFKEVRILQLPPSFGSNYFELADFNKDGYPDIIATNGDNGDYPPILKAYHGIRIYLNDGNNHFTEKLFLHVNGTGKAIAADFDGDGDIDIASIAFFPDYTNRPEEGFIYWENKGRFLYEPTTFGDVSTGRWLTMDAGDIDGDGDIDIVLGNANFFIGALPGAIKKKLDMYSPSVLILTNTLR